MHRFVAAQRREGGRDIEQISGTACTLVVELELPLGALDLTLVGAHVVRDHAERGIRVD